MARNKQLWNSSRGPKNRQDWLKKHGGSFEKVNSQWRWIEPQSAPVVSKPTKKKTSKKKGV